ncbi:hypothetical protein [Flexivirga alba]|uniref:Mandelate racemase/muconate lactonizing enzyme N-terminal domain-containing protein n=1 Tax=Flexivirga alba TaxID=702742 RepID=A0ABW2AJG8_9MICO
MRPGAVVDEVEVRALSFATSAPESDGTLTWDHINVVTVEVRAGPEVGLGWSYTSPAAVEIIRSVLAPEVLGEDPSSPGRLWERMHRACRNLGTRGVAMAAISAMDIAFWDLRSKGLRCRWRTFGVRTATRSRSTGPAASHRWTKVSSTSRSKRG